MGLNGKVNGQGVFAVTFGHPRVRGNREESGANRMRRAEGRHMLQSRWTGRAHERLEVGRGKDRPEVRLRRKVCKKERERKKNRTWSPGTKSLYRTQGIAAPSADGDKEEGKVPLI